MSLDELFGNTDRETELATDTITCQKYRWNSCPKELVDWVTQVYIQEVQGVDPSKSVMTKSNISDLMEKSRKNSFHQSIFHFIGFFFLTSFFSFFIFYVTNNTWENGYETPWWAIAGFVISSTFLIFVYFFFFWFGILRGMAVGRVTKEIVYSGLKPFFKWYAATLTILISGTVILVNTPIIVKSIALWGLSHMENHKVVYKSILGQDSFFYLQEFKDKINTYDIGNFSIILNISIFAILIMMISSAYFGFRNGYHEQLESNNEEWEVSEDKKNFSFDRAINKINELYS